MIKSIVSRDDSIYECFPDIAKCNDGTLVCIYRESMAHAAYPFSSLVCRRSTDEGRTWHTKQIIDECIIDQKTFKDYKSFLTEDEIIKYKEALSRVKKPENIGCFLNCPRIISLKDGQLLIVADYYVKDIETKANKWINKFFRSFDYGVTWEGPELPKLPEGLLVPSLNELRDGRLMLGLGSEELDENDDFLATHYVLFSDDKGKSWSSPVEIHAEKGINLSEGSFLELDDGTILGIMRDDNLGRGYRQLKDGSLKLYNSVGCGYKVLSKDGGKTWLGPYKTELIGLQGRAKVGRLRSGEICITYRICLPNVMLAMHIMTQDAAKFEGEQAMIDREPIPEIKENKYQKVWYMKQYYPGRTIVLDIDRSVHRDCGYSGWVQLESGDIYVVDYINDDAPRAHIRSYTVNRNEVILFPEGDLPWLHPSSQPFIEMTFKMAERQMKKNRQKKK
ncbi:MAG: exo-alpha-sialidase [Ruminiclostridium sp.]|nr:exo-alpha-sialidase [Ruminiclostridium sp.]